MKPIITTDLVVAYAHCPRKAYLLLVNSSPGTPHEYTQILEKQRQVSQANYLNKLAQSTLDVQPYTTHDLASKRAYLTDAILSSTTFEAACTLLTKVASHSALGHYSYEPTIFIGTHKISHEQKLALFFTAYVLEQLQKKAPTVGHIIDVTGKAHKVTLTEGTQTLQPILEPLQEWLTDDALTEPPVILNKHCSLCQFRDACRAKAEQENNLSLLANVTPKIIRRYEKKGIFTVKQLSYTFKPRKRKKRTKNPPPLVHKLELQALAIREQKIYLQELPNLPRQPVELFLDIEGIPDQDTYYLIGLLVCEQGTSSYHSFWADTIEDEAKIWQQFLEKVNAYPEAPIYHYGSYEVNTLQKLARRYDTDIKPFASRLANVNSFIYGKVYFPVYSNGLKEIGKFIGASWSSSDASGVQSLVWRYYWRETKETKFQALLLTYNREDCQALKSFRDYFLRIAEASEPSNEIIDIDKHQAKTTPIQTEISRQFKLIFKLARFEYDKTKISFNQNQESSDNEQIRKRQQNARKAQHKKDLERKRRAKRKIQVPDEKFCPKCDQIPLRRTKIVSRRYIIDLILMRNGIRKAVTEYWGFQGYCSKCYRNHIPPEIKKYGIKQAYGHGFGAWIVYQRVELRLSYDNIVNSLREQFNESIRASLCIDMINRFAINYAETIDLILHRLLQSPFIHADETRANIRGINWYVWCFTDGKNTIYQLHQSREGQIAQVFFAKYDGVVISDFYPGYDSIECEQQKCWVHLIRDLNNDLKENPFDREFECFVLSIRNLIIPIMEEVRRFGLKKHYLKEFEKNVEEFYKNNIENKAFKSDIAQTYIKRFIRYRQSLFTFLRKDGIPWHNNTAESAVKHFAKQRDTSGPMYESVTHNYLTLLSIQQTCHNNGKSFMQFLFSEETDVYAFKRYKR